MSVLTPHRNTVCKKRRAPINPQNPQNPRNPHKPQRPQAKPRRLFNNPNDEISCTQLSELDPDEKVRRELGLDTENLIQGSDGEQGEILHLDDGYTY